MTGNADTAASVEKTLNDAWSTLAALDDDEGLSDVLINLADAAAALHLYVRRNDGSSDDRC